MPKFNQVHNTTILLFIAFQLHSQLNSCNTRTTILLDPNNLTGRRIFHR